MATPSPTGNSAQPTSGITGLTGSKNWLIMPTRKATKNQPSRRRRAGVAPRI